MSERVEKMGRQVEYRQESKRLTTECEALCDSLRRALPLAEEMDTLDRDKILTLAVALNQSLLELAGVNRKLEILSRDLGI